MGFHETKRSGNASYNLNDFIYMYGHKSLAYKSKMYHFETNNESESVGNTKTIKQALFHTQYSQYASTEAPLD